MRFVVSLFIDVFCILLATLGAVILRDSFVLSTDRLLDLAPYFVSTTIASFIILPIFRVNLAFWRLSTVPDYLRIAAALFAITSASVAMTFAINRVEDVPRSLPFLQFYLSATLMLGGRLIYRWHHTSRHSSRQTMTPFRVSDEQEAKTILLVGLSPLTETYLQSVSELGRRRIRVAGILGLRDRHVGRLVAAHKVLGLPEDLRIVLSELEVSGVVIERIVVTVPFRLLSRRARDVLSAAQRAGTVEVQFLAEMLGFEPTPTNISERTDDADKPPVEFVIHDDELETMRGRFYWRAKRAFDIAASLSLIVVLGAPLALIGLIVTASTGWPPVFWQERPGLGGRRFCLYKFRTMSGSVAADGRRLPDHERVTIVGDFLRRCRLDELPQLLNIVRGEMSFIGPRPLLPRDQDEAFRARLLVRPGLTGWAQVVGGRAISPEDKAALDVWYVRNAGFLLDLEIILKTIPVIILGERTSEALIERAWRDLRDTGVLTGRYRGAPVAGLGPHG